nr:uncharacterized protein LOC124808071 isoform X1 [Hydra vulgaris]
MQALWNKKQLKMNQKMCDEIEISEQVEEPENDKVTNFKEQLRQLLFIVYVKYGCLDIIQEGFTDLLEGLMFSDKLKNVANNLDAVHISTTKTQLEPVIQEIDNVKPTLKEVGYFEQQLKHFKNHMKFVEPVGRPISVRYESRLDKETGKICQYPIPNTYQYIPIHQTIRFVYSYMYDILKKQQRNTNNLISDFSDASRFKECQLFIENWDALQLHLYFDDFETVNPLGSKTKIHRLGAVYMVIRNLPSYLNSRLVHIYLVCFFYTEDTKTTRGYE